MKGYRKYFAKKILWFFLTLIIAFVLNFVLPRLTPADPVANIMSRTARGVHDSAVTKAMYENYVKAFGLDKPAIVQFTTYVKNALKGDFGQSFSQYPRKVNDIISSAILWTIGLQMPAIIVGWLLGNILGALAAYIRKGFDKFLMPLSLFFSCVPAFGMAVILLGLFAVRLKVLPIAGGYGFDLIPTFSWKFVKSILLHYQLPFWSVVIISIGGQAIGMRSMSLYMS